MPKQLETSLELLERARARHQCSWYRLGQLVEASENTITNWKNGRTTVDSKFAPKLAELIDEQPEYVLLCLEHERETSPEVRKIWRRLAGLITHGAASILLGTVAVLGLVALPSQRASAQDAPASLARSVYYVKWRIWLARALDLLLPRSGLAPVF